MSDVSEFFAAYEERRARCWGDEIHLLGPTERGLYESQQLRAPRLDPARVKAELANAGFGDAGVSAFVEFVSAWSYVALDCDGWIEFASTAAPDIWERDIRRMGSGLDGARFFVFGHDPATSAVFVLDRGNQGMLARPLISIVDQGRIVEGVFSDFESLLRVLARVLVSETPLFVERGGEPDDEQRRLVGELRSIDPEGFGAVGWERWYRRATGMEPHEF